MISWLKGEKIDAWHRSSRYVIVLNCGGVGYEVQTLPRQFLNMNNQLILWTHQIYRDDGYSLYGFINRLERDLFRILISVNGVGPQMGLALLEESEVIELVFAITNANLDTLTRAQGVGKRTAERIAIELRNKIADFSINIPESHITLENKEEELLSIPLSESQLNELKNTLLGLGYEDLEIRRALKEIFKNNQPKNAADSNETPGATGNLDSFLKQALLWLSKQAA